MKMIIKTGWIIVSVFGREGEAPGGAPSRYGNVGVANTAEVSLPKVKGAG
jgi:hypothetical protein